MLWDLARLAIRVAVRRVHGLLVAEQWILAVQKGDDHGMAPTLEFGTATEIVPPDDRFWADPFPVEVDGRWHIFIEEYPFATRQGHLAVLSDAGGSWTAPIAILDRSVHRSYPFVFRHGTDWFLVPESSALGRVELYRSLDFPTAWTLDRVLLDLPGVDPTLVEIEGLWWMFMGIIGDLGAHNEELHLFNAESPFGPWQPHPMNPVRSDIRGARPAGRPYSVDGVWYRPGQDGVGGYGSGVIIHRITRLDREAYDEEAVREIRPAGRRGRVGVHTINAAAGLTVVDFRRRRSLGDRLRSRARR